MTETLQSYLALGDSYTIGEGVAEEDRWPVQLARALRGQGVPLEDPVVVARTGWTTDELIEGIETAGIRGSFGLVSLLIGVNNQYRGRGVEEFREQLQELLSVAVSFTGGDPGRALVLSIPDWGVTPFAAGRDRGRIAVEIDTFNQVVRNEALDSRCHFLDVTPLSREGGEDPGLLAPDGLHPSGVMYRRWVEKALPMVGRILSREGCI